MVDVIQTYINCIKSGKMKLEDVPERYRDKVEKQMEADK